MAKKNLYYKAVFQRINVIKVGILGLFLAICSWPRVFIESFTRKSFGERYFLFPLNLFLAAILTVIPYISHGFGSSFFTVVSQNITWYGYIAAFVYVSYKRYLEVKREPGVYDFKKFSLSTGLLQQWVLDLVGRIHKPSLRNMATYWEPGIFFIGGIILIILQQQIGYLFVVCSIIYGFSWAAQYNIGDHFIMDTIDKMISNEELTNSFVHDREPLYTRGFEVYGERPDNAEFRRKVAENMFEDEPPADVF